MNKDIIEQWKIFTTYLNLKSNSHISNLILLSLSNMIIDNWIRKAIENLSDLIKNGLTLTRSIFKEYLDNNEILSYNPELLHILQDYEAIEIHYTVFHRSIFKRLLKEKYGVKD